MSLIDDLARLIATPTPIYRSVEIVRSYLTLPLWEGYSKWFGKMSVCVSDPAVPQELDTFGLPYLAYIHSSKVARTSTH